jgi:hypothetical protein
MGTTWTSVYVVGWRLWHTSAIPAPIIDFSLCHRHHKKRATRLFSLRSTVAERTMSRQFWWSLPTSNVRYGDNSSTRL